MKVRYNCFCLKEDREVDVPDRIEGSPIEPWMDILGRCLKFDHGQISPLCTSNVAKNVMIPVTDNGVGVPETQQ
jgi:hypothetical protein